MTRGAPIPETVTLHVPFRVVKRGGRKEMQLPAGVSQTPKTDSTLVKALARAFRWKRMLEFGRVRHHRRTGRARGDRLHLHGPCLAPYAACARHRRSYPRRETELGRHAEGAHGAISVGVAITDGAAFLSARQMKFATIRGLRQLGFQMTLRQIGDIGAYHVGHFQMVIWRIFCPRAQGTGYCAR